MDPLIIGGIGLGFIFILVVLGMRIAFATAIVGVVGILILRDWGAASGVAGFLPHGIVAHYPLSVIPLFIIMGYFAFFAGLTRDLFWTARQWLGHLPGGMAIACVFGCAGFAACSGASTASAAVMGRIAIPEMREAGYQKGLAAGVVAAGGTLATLIPPSVLLVIYGILTEQSIGALLMAGFIPGIVSAIIYAMMIYVRVRLNPSLGAPAPPVPWKKRFTSLRGTWGMLVLITFVLGGIYTGVFTPTEAGGMAALGAFVMAVSMRRLTWARLKESLLETGRTTVMIFAIIVGVLIFVRFLALSGLPRTFAETVLAWPVHPIVVLLAILGVYIFLGMFLDALGMMMLTLPIVFPAITALGFDPIWFGIILVKMCEICLITPPVGLNVYVVRSVAPDISLEEIFKGILPFFLMDILTVGVLIIFPQIVTFLPNTMMKMRR